jgi:hypothetical protein
MTQRRSLIVQQEKIAQIGVSDHIDRIVDGRGLRQRVITQPRPNWDMSHRSASHKSISIADQSTTSEKAAWHVGDIFSH